MGDVAAATSTGGAQSALAAPDQVTLDGLAGELRDRHSTSRRLVTEPGVEVVWELDRRPFHGMPAYPADSALTAVRLTWVANRRPAAEADFADKRASANEREQRFPDPRDARIIRSRGSGSSGDPHSYSRVVPGRKDVRRAATHSSRSSSMGLRRRTRALAPSAESTEPPITSAASVPSRPRGNVNRSGGKTKIGRRIWTNM